MLWSLLSLVSSPLLFCFLGEDLVADSPFSFLLWDVSGRILPLSKEELGVWPEGSGAKLLAALDAQEFKPFKKYIEKIEAWDAYQKSYGTGSFLVLLFFFSLPPHLSFSPTRRVSLERSFLSFFLISMELTKPAYFIF